jgi:hypothetical protein
MLTSAIGFLVNARLQNIVQSESRGTSEPLDRRIFLGVAIRKTYDHSTFGESFSTGSRTGTMVRDYKPSRLATVVASVVILITAGMSRTDEPEEGKSLVTPRGVFARLKSLVGTWNNDVSSTKSMKHDAAARSSTV